MRQTVHSGRRLRNHNPDPSTGRKKGGACGRGGEFASGEGQGATGRRAVVGARGECGWCVSPRAQHKSVQHPVAAGHCSKGLGSTIMH